MCVSPWRRPQAGPFPGPRWPCPAWGRDRRAPTCRPAVGRRGCREPRGRPAAPRGGRRGRNCRIGCGLGSCKSQGSAAAAGYATDNAALSARCRLQLKADDAIMPAGSSGHRLCRPTRPAPAHSPGRILSPAPARRLGSELPSVYISPSYAGSKPDSRACAAGELLLRAAGPGPARVRARDRLAAGGPAARARPGDGNGGRRRPRLRRIPAGWTGRAEAAPGPAGREPAGSASLGASCLEN